MIDLNLLRIDAAHTKDLIIRKEPSFNVESLVALDHQTRTIRTDVEALRQEKNNFAAKGAQGLSPTLREQAQNLGKALKDKEALEKSEGSS